MVCDSVSFIYWITVQTGYLNFAGFFVTRHYEFMMGQDLKELYHYNLVDQNALVKMKCQVLRNLHHYLIEEESRMMRAEEECKCCH